MRISGTRSYYRPSPPKMPPGLVELMEGLSKEVLKTNPTDIYAFCANHVQQLLEIRDGPLRKDLILEEKIAKAQAKVRHRAEKRRQDYDKNVQQIKMIENFDKLNPGDTAESFLKEPETDNLLRAPIHHELGDLSEVEISLDQSVELQSKDNISTNQNVVGQTAEKTSDMSNEAINMVNEIKENNAGNNFPLQTNENVIQDVSLHSVTIPDTEMPAGNTNTLETVNSINNLSNSAHDETKEHIEVNHDLVSGVEIIQEPDTFTSQSPLIENTTVVVDEPNYDDKNEVSEIIDDKIKDVNNQNNNSELVTNETVNKENDITNTNAHHISDETGESLQSINKESIIQPAVAEHIQQSGQTDNVEHTHKEEPVPKSDDNIKALNAVSSINIENTHSEPSKEKETINEQIDVSYCRDKDENAEIHETLKNASDQESKQPFIDLPTSDTDCEVDPLITDDTVKETHKLDDHLKTDGENSGVPPIDKASDDINIVADDQTKDSPTTSSVSNTSDDTMVLEDKDEISSNLDDNSQNPNHESSNMDLETAAVTIQKVFRNFLFKSRASTFDDSVNDDQSFMDEDEDKNKEECDYTLSSVLNMDRRPHGLTRMDTVLQTVNEEKSLSLSTDDSSTLSSAATIIQAHVRGFLVRNRINSNRTVSTNSLAASNSNEPSLTSLEVDNEHTKNKTVLNIHIVPEGGNYLSRDESLITSMDLSLDGSPPSSINLHPLGYDKSERRKQLKREDAIQSISPPSNNSGKLSEDVESVKDLLLNDQTSPVVHEEINTIINYYPYEDTNEVNHIVAPVDDSDLNTVEKLTLLNVETDIRDVEKHKLNEKRRSFSKMSSDEMDVVTPYIENNAIESKLIHSGEFHDAVLPTKVLRSDTSVVSGE